MPCWYAWFNTMKGCIHQHDDSIQVRLKYIEVERHQQVIDKSPYNG